MTPLPDAARRGSAADLFLTFQGRLERERWRGAVILLVALAVLGHLATWGLARAGLIGGHARDVARIGVQAFLLVPWLALDWKRFQDLAWPGACALLCPGLMLAARLWDLGPAGPLKVTVAAGLAWLQLAVAAILAYLLALRAGTPGPNRYGSQPG